MDDDMNYKNKMIEFIIDEAVYLNRNDKINIRDIIINYYKENVERYMTTTTTGLKIDLEKVDIDCLKKIIKYIENEYEKLVAYRNEYCVCDLEGNMPLKFSYP